MKGRARPLWLELSAAILLALFASNAITFAIAEAQRSSEIKAERLSAIQDRLKALLTLLPRIPESERDALFKVASVSRERVSIGEIPRVAGDATRDTASEAKLVTALGPLAPGDVRVAKRGAPDLWLFGPKKRAGFERLSVAIALAPGRWLNAEFLWPQGASLLPGLLLSAAVASLALFAVAIWIAYRLSRPLQRLSQASVRMAEGEAVDPIPEQGPAVVKAAAQSFNTMSRRLTAMLDNQRTLLRSIGHDLRTPITSLKLKTEFIDDADVKRGMQRSLDELHAMTEAALDAARTGMGEEAPRDVDITALVDSLCNDLADLGADVAFVPGTTVRMRCRPNDVKRAARNLIENAMKYGKRASVAVRRQNGSVVILVDDEGPGLDDSETKRAFEPFARGETAGTTAGFGLGLTLARAVARNHNGDLTLANREEGGLSAKLTLVPSVAAE